MLVCSRVPNPNPNPISDPSLTLTTNPITLTLRRSTLLRRAGASGQPLCETQAGDMAGLGRGGGEGGEGRVGVSSGPPRERLGGGGCGLVEAVWPGATGVRHALAW